jgi:prepilin-type N-terminal cleavage/methylation domain-containing protein
MKKRRLRLKLCSGFTLIELLVVIAIVASLAIVVFTAIKPSERLKNARDIRRKNDIKSIIDSVNLYIIENGTWPIGIDNYDQSQYPLNSLTSPYQLGTAFDGCDLTGSTTGCNVTNGPCLDLFNGTYPNIGLSKYLKKLPVDPLGTNQRSKYVISVTPNTNLLTIKACSVDNFTSNPISISR